MPTSEEQVPTMTTSLDHLGTRTHTSTLHQVRDSADFETAQSRLARLYCTSYEYEYLTLYCASIIYHPTLSSYTI